MARDGPPWTSIRQDQGGLERYDTLGFVQLNLGLPRGWTHPCEQPVAQWAPESSSQPSRSHIQGGWDCWCVFPLSVWKPGGQLECNSDRCNLLLVWKHPFQIQPETRGIKRAALAHFQDCHLMNIFKLIWRKWQKRVRFQIGEISVRPYSNHSPHLQPEACRKQKLPSRKVTQRHLPAAAWPSRPLAEGRSPWLQGLPKSLGREDLPLSSQEMGTGLWELHKLLVHDVHLCVFMRYTHTLPVWTLGRIYLSSGGHLSPSVIFRKFF